MDMQPIGLEQFVAYSNLRGEELLRPRDATEMDVRLACALELIDERIADLIDAKPVEPWPDFERRITHETLEGFVPPIPRSEWLRGRATLGYWLDRLRTEEQEHRRGQRAQQRAAATPTHRVAV